ncbi:MAG: hypothetical protein N2Z80_07350 [Hydrogenothermaceae bacterium]|nr:hypothetical protein [Hydrogenothermaceae bacterium]
MKISIKDFIYYKFLNSLFTGLSVGSVFSVYSPLPQTVYSIGGILLSVGMILLAKMYNRILKVNFFFAFSLLVEIVLLAVMLLFLIKPYDYMTALLFYSGYQLTFIFGSYLLRAETIFLRHVRVLSKIDISKQAGYLLGMFLSFGFYKILETAFNVKDNQDQVYYLHFLLLFLELFVILSIFRAFRVFR